MGGSSNEMIRLRMSQKNCQTNGENAAAALVLGQPAGRVVTPIVPGERMFNEIPKDALSCCVETVLLLRELIKQNDQIMHILRTTPEQLKKVFEESFILPTTDCIPFVQPSGDITLTAVASGGLANITVASVTVPEGYIGVLTKFGQAISPNTAGSVQWSLAIGGDESPKLGTTSFSASTLATPYDFPLEIPSGRTLELRATNSGTSGVTANGILIGYMKPTRV